MLRRIRPATPENPPITPAGGGGTGQAGRRRGTAHLPGGTYPAAAQSDTAGKRQKNIPELFAGFRKCSIFCTRNTKNGALVQLVRIRACHARGQGVRVPYAPPANRREKPRRQENRKRGSLRLPRFSFPHRMAVRMGKGEADKGTSASIRVRCRNARASRQPACRAKTGTRNETFRGGSDVFINEQIRFRMKYYFDEIVPRRGRTRSNGIWIPIPRCCPCGWPTWTSARRPLSQPP